MLSLTIRVTIVLDNENAKKLRTKQAKRINDTNKGYSFSQAINDVLSKAMKN